jgi:hypothetical protein
MEEKITPETEVLSEKKTQGPKKSKKKKSPLPPKFPVATTLAKGRAVFCFGFPVFCREWFETIPYRYTCPLL